MVTKDSLNVRSLRADALWNVLGSLVYAGCQWGILIATVKLSSAANVGRLSLGFAVSAPIFLLLHLRLRAASATDVGLSFTRGTYLSLRAISTVAALLCTGAACIIFRLPHLTTLIVMWVGAAKAIESGSDLMYGLAQQAGDLRSVALSMMGRGLLALLLFSGVLRQTHSLGWAMAGLCIAWGSVFLFFDLPNGLRRPAAASEDLGGNATLQTGRDERLRRLLKLTLPLGLSTMFMSLMANMPRYFVEHTLGIAALGIFSAAAYLTMTVSVIISAIAEASLAHLARGFAARDTSQASALLNRVLGVTVGLSGLAIGASLLLGKPMLRLVYRASYSDAAGLLTALMVVAALANLASVYGYALIAARCFKRYLGVLSFSAACTAAACAVLIPRWGTSGAAAACMIGYGTQLLCSWLLLRPELVTREAALTSGTFSIAKV